MSGDAHSLWMPAPCSCVPDRDAHAAKSDRAGDKTNGSDEQANGGHNGGEYADADVGSVAELAPRTPDVQADVVTHR